MSTDTDVETSLDPIGHPVADADTRDREQTVEVRRRAGLAVVLGAGSSLIAVAYLARAVTHGGILDWVLFAVLGAIGAYHLAALLDARTPLLVADELGVRLRLGRSWVGFPWGGLHEVEHRARRGWWHDGALVVRPHYVQRLIEDLDPGVRRTTRVNCRLHGAPLAVPLGLATRLVGAEPDLSTALAALAAGRTPIVETGQPEVTDIEPTLEPTPEPVSQPVPVTVTGVEDRSAAVAEDQPTTETTDGPAPTPGRFRDPRPALALLIGTLAARFERTPAEASAEPSPDLVASETPGPGRVTVAATRAEVRHESRVALTDDGTSEVAEAEKPPAVEPAAPAETSVTALIIDGYAARSAAEPVIGPQFASARRTLGLTVDQLAERTRIRPHVIEAIEVDDFSACGGDFYARGHLRTLARVLGVDVVPLLETYDEHYADAPIDPRRVFEAELAGAGSIRATRGGPNWSVLVAAVMALVLCWSVARLVTAGPGHPTDEAVLSGSAGPHHSSAASTEPVPVLVTSLGDGTSVVIRDGHGKVVYSGVLALGQSHHLQASPPVKVQSTDGAVRVRVAGQSRGTMGPAGLPATKSYAVPR